MVKELRRLDVSKIPELQRLAQEVADSGEGLVLRDNDTDLAMVAPVKTRARGRRPRERTQADVEAFRSAAGSWADVDTEELKRWIYTGRESSRPPVDL
jgi:hypothetical protein